jgi:hypothetical protein
MPLSLITGASAGLGAEFARQLAGRRHDLVLVARDAARLAALGAELTAAHGVRCTPLVADLASGDGITKVVSAITALDAPLDHLVNNAGFGLTGTIARADPGPQVAMLRLHVEAPMRLTRAALPAMLAADRGAVINVASVASYLYGPGSVNYCATKAYLRYFTLGLDTELRHTRVVAQALCPGFVHTEFHQRMGFDKVTVPRWLWLDAPRVVRESLAAAARGGPCVVMPSIRYRVLIGALRLLPHAVTRRLAGRGPRARGDRPPRGG